MRNIIRQKIRESLIADISDYKSRVNAGKNKESKIISQLKKFGVDIEEPTPEEDMYDKIDGWINQNGKRTSVQIKFRESGDDILFEIMKDFDKGREGRDLIGKSELYLVVNRAGLGRLLLTSEIKKLAKQFVKAVPQAIQQNPEKNSWKGEGWEVKLTYDRATGQRKLIGFFSPNIFSIQDKWQFKF
jgi:hypothetical protein